MREGSRAAVLALAIALAAQPLSSTSVSAQTAARDTTATDDAPRSDQPDFLDDPAFWIITIGAAAAIGLAVGAAVYSATEPQPYGGSLSIRFDVS